MTALRTESAALACAMRGGKDGAPKVARRSATGKAAVRGKQGGGAHGRPLPSEASANAPQHSSDSPSRAARAPECSEKGRFAAVVRAEFLKGRRAAPRKVALIAPLPFVVMGFAAAGVFGGGFFGGFATVGWNYWYALPLPVVVALLAASVANIDGKHKLRSVLGLPVSMRQVWWAKVLYVLALVFASNLVILAASLVAGLSDPDTPNVFAGLVTAVLLTVGNAWMVPAALFLATRVNTMTAIAVPAFLQLAAGTVLWASGIWWLVPSSAVLRAVSPFVGVMPSGVPLQAGDAMLEFGWQAAVGMGICVAFAAVLAVAGAAWYANREAK